MPATLFLINPNLPSWILGFLLVFWSVAFLLDAGITVSCKDLARFESNPLFRCLARRFSIPISVALQAAFEAGLGLVAQYALSLRFGPDSIEVVASVFGIAHIMAWRSNKRFLARNNAGSPQ